VAALRAAQLGARVALIEQEKIGGVCLNVGCIPTKSLLRSAEVYRTLEHVEDFGLRLAGRVEPDWPAIQARKEAIVEQLVSGVETLLQKAGVRVIHGRGRLVAPRRLAVETAEGTLLVDATRGIIIGAGSRSMRLPLSGMELAGILDSTGALALEELPRRLLIVGGGVVGVEFADLFSAFGVEVIVVEMLGRLLPQMDADLGPALAWILEQRRVRIHVNSRLTRVAAVEGGLLAAISGREGEEVLEADLILVAVGRRPNVDDLGLEAAGVFFDQAGIPVNDRMATNIPGVYAIGDVTGGSLLAHAAMHGGEVAVESVLGQPAAFNPQTIPWCVYTDPEVASVGLTEAQAREAGYDVRVGRFPLSASGKALTHSQAEGFAKVVSEARFGQVLGLHIVAPHASDLIHEGALGLALEATTDEFAATVHAHPTLAEAVREAVLEVRGGALHLPWREKQQDLPET